MNNPLVSAVITTYKRPADIVERALKSIIYQTYNNMEIIIVDDSPEGFEHRDSIDRMTKKYPNVIYHQHEKNFGACVARNTGLSLAHGEFIGYLDDDDEWMPEKISKQVAVFAQSSKDTALVYCGNIIRKDNTGEEYPDNMDFRTGEIDDIHVQLVRRNFIGSTSFPLLRTEVLRSIGGFDPLLKSAQDADVWIRISERYRINFVPESLVIYHKHEGEQISKNPKNKIQGLERIIEKNRDIFENDKEAKYLGTMALVVPYAADSQIGVALKKWVAAVLTGPFHIERNIKELYRLIKYGKK